VAAVDRALRMRRPVNALILSVRTFTVVGFSRRMAARFIGPVPVRPAIPKDTGTFRY